LKNTIDTRLSLKRRLSKYICKFLKRETKKLHCANVSENTNDSPNLFFVFQQFENNYNEKIINSTVIKSSDSKIRHNNCTQNLNDYDKELKKNNLYCHEMTESIMDSVTELCVLIADESPQVKSILQNHKETKRLLSKLNTLSKISENKTMFNNKFLEYFSGPN